DGEVTTPRDKSWLTGITMANVPDIPVRPVGSGECPNVDCDKINDDSCFESCGNKATEFDIYGCPEPQQWSLTFDDGPSNFTTKLLDYLDEADIKATFCVMGSNVEKYPEIVKRAFDSGHQIASHTYSHPHLMSLTNEEIIYEVRATEKAIEKVIGVKPTYLRPPYGEADQRVKAILKEMGYKILLWNVDPTDYDVYMLPSAPKKILGSFKMAVGGKDTGLNAHEDPGFISLQHDLYEESIDQIPSIIKLLKTKGYVFSTSAACHNDNNPH
ncbi:carbohydrate esterase family 4 protein, partial [Backusella circina FSU 941]